MLEAGMVACWEDLVKDTKLFYVLEKNSSCNFIVIVIVTLLKVFPGEKTDSTDGDKAENDEKLRLETTTTKNIRHETNLKAFEEAGVDDHLAERVNLRNERASSIRFSVFSFHNISAFIFLIAALHRKCVSVN